MTPPGQDTNTSQVNPQEKLVLIYTAESTGASRVKCLAQGQTTQWSGWVRTHDLWVTSRARKPLDHSTALEVNINKLISDKREWNNCFIRFYQILIAQIFRDLVSRSIFQQPLAQSVSIYSNMVYELMNKIEITNQNARNPISEAGNIIVIYIHQTPKSALYIFKNYIQKF